MKPISAYSTAYPSGDAALQTLTLLRPAEHPPAAWMTEAIQYTRLGSTASLLSTSTFIPFITSSHWSYSGTWVGMREERETVNGLGWQRRVLASWLRESLRPSPFCISHWMRKARHRTRDEEMSRMCLLSLESRVREWRRVDRGNGWRSRVRQP